MATYDYSKLVDIALFLVPTLSFRVGTQHVFLFYSTLLQSCQYSWVFTRLSSDFVLKRLQKKEEAFHCILRMLPKDSILGVALVTSFRTTPTAPVTSTLHETVIVGGIMIIRHHVTITFNRDEVAII